MKGPGSGGVCTAIGGMGKNGFHGRGRLSSSGRKFFRLLFRVIGTSDQWSGFDDLETQIEAEFSIGIELLGRDPAINREMVPGWLEILANRENVRIGP